MYSLPTSWTLAALTIASAASTAPTKPFVSTMPRASILIVFSESEYLSLMNPNHKLAVESAQAVPGSAARPRLRASANRPLQESAGRDGRRSQVAPLAPFVFPRRLNIDFPSSRRLSLSFHDFPALVSP